MKRMLLAIAAAALAVPAAQADEMASVKLGYQYMTASGTFAGNKGGQQGTLSFGGGNGVAKFKKSTNTTGEVALQLGDWRLSVGYLPVKTSATGTLNTRLTFGGQQFNVNQSVTADAKVDLVDVGLTWYLVNMDDIPTRFQLGPELSIKSARANLQLSSLGQTATVSKTVPIPTIGARARIALADFLGVVGRIGWIGSGKNKFVDTDLQVEFSPLPLVGVYAGYRQIQVKVDQNNVYLDATFKGPYAGVFARF